MSAEREEWYMQDRQAEAINGLLTVIAAGQAIALNIASRTRLTAQDAAPYSLSPLAHALLNETAPKTTRPPKTAGGHRL